MAKEERVPRSIDDWVILILLIIATLAFTGYTIDFFLGFLHLA